MATPATNASHARGNNQPRERPARLRDLAFAIVIGGGLAAAVNAVIAAIAHGPLDASTQFQPLTPTAFITWTIIGTVIGASGWFLITRRARNPRTLLRRLVPTVVLVSLIPDIAVWISDAIPGTGPTEILTLMTMHLTTAAILVTAFQHFMPTPNTARR